MPYDGEIKQFAELVLSVLHESDYGGCRFMLSLIQPLVDRSMKVA